MRSPPTSPACRRKRLGLPSCSASARGWDCRRKVSTATSTSPTRRPRRSSSSCASAACRSAGWRSWRSARPRWRAAGWRNSEQGARSHHARARSARCDARLDGRRTRDRRAAHGRDQGACGRCPRGESGRPPGARHGCGRDGRRCLLASSRGARGITRRPRERHSRRRGRGARREHRSRPPRAAPRCRGGSMSPQTRAVESWTLQPLTDFVKEASVRLVLVLTPAGQVLAQSGFSRAVDVMSAAALAAAIVATTGELARQLQQPPFAALSHQGPKHGFFLATFVTDRGALAVLAVYDLDVSSLGLVQLFYEQLAADLKAATPKGTVPKQVLAADFERELTDSLNTLFGR